MNGPRINPPHNNKRVRNTSIGLSLYSAYDNFKRGLFKLIDNFDDTFGKMQYFKAIKYIGRVTGITNASLAWYEYSKNPTTGNLLQAVGSTGLFFARVNPWVMVVVGVSDATGLSDYIYDGIGDVIDNNILNKK